MADFNLSVTASDLNAAIAKANAAAPQSTTYTKTEVDTALAAKLDASDIDAALSTTSTNPVQNNTLYTKFLDIDANIAAIRVMMDAVLYGYRVNKNDSNPETRVEYLYDAVGMTPARMNFTTGQFDYGSWANVWFVAGNKPVALKFDGTVDYELDPNDYSKKADGTASDITDSTYAGNFMATMPTVWIKRWEDDNYRYCAISNKQITPEFKANAHDAGDGTINPVIYLPMFKGVILSSKMRSIAGVTPQGNTTGSTEKTAAEACGSGWQLWDLSKHELLSDLLTLISRSTNSQAAFGKGDTNTYNSSDTTTYGKLNTGQHKVDGVWTMYGGGRFWGAADDNHHVRVFHIEDFWGNRWDRCLGLNLVSNEYVYKLVRPYALEPDSTYTSSGLYAPNSGAYQKEQYTGEYGALPKTTGGSGVNETTYECDYFSKDGSGTRLLLFGGRCSDRALCGSRSLALGIAASIGDWSFGGSPCFNTPHEGV